MIAPCSASSADAFVRPIILGVLTLGVLVSTAPAQCPAGGYVPPPPPPNVSTKPGVPWIVPPRAATPGPRTRPPAPVTPPPSHTPPGRTPPRVGGRFTPPSTRRGGQPLTFTRGATARTRLTIDWDVPVYRAPRRSPEQTSATSFALTRAEAFAFIAGEDRRPLLVLRECVHCLGTDRALLRQATDNERTMLLTQWFHCVKLPASVVHELHPLRRLFPTSRPHVFLSTHDGKNVVTFSGKQSQTAVWKGMKKLLRSTYERDATRVLQRIVKILDEFDELDSKQLAIRRRLDQAMEKDGPKSPKFRSLRSKFEKLQTRRQELLADEKQLLDLGWKGDKKRGG